MSYATRWRCNEKRGQDPYRRVCSECGLYESYQHDDDSWICERCGHVEASATAKTGTK